MSHLSGRDLRRVQYTHQRNVGVVVRRLFGGSMTLEDLPPLIDGTINFTSDGIRRRASLTFESQTPPLDFLDLLDEDNAAWTPYLDDEPQGQYFLRDFSEDDPGENRNFRIYLQDESALIAERKTTQTEIFKGDLITVCENILNGSNRTLIYTGLRLIGIPVEIILEQDKDRWATVVNLLEQYGLEILMDRSGGVLIRPFPEVKISTAKDWTSLILSKQSTHSRRSINHLIIQSRTDNDILRLDYYDTDPASKSYFYGPYGDVPKTINVQGLAGVETDGSGTTCECLAIRLARQYFGRRISETVSCMQVGKMDLGDSYRIDDKVYKADQLSFSISPTRPMYLTGRGEPVAVKA